MTNAKFYLNLPDHHSFPKALPLILRIRVIRSSRELEVKNRDARFFQACPDSSESLGSDNYSLPKPHIPTGGRLYHFQKAWKNISTDKWTQSVIRNGYRIQFCVHPKLTRVVPQYLRVTPSDPEKIQLLQTELKSMLDKHAIEPVSSCHPKDGYYSRLFLVRKKLGGWRPVIDLSRLNRHVITPHFKMETLDSVRLSLRKHDWAISLDLTDAYFHIPIHRKSRRFLRFFFMGKNIPVSSLAIRPGSSFLRVLQNCEGSGQTLSSHGHASIFLSRRLAPAVSISSDVFVAQRSTTEHSFVPEICSQLGQIRSSSQSEVFFSGSTFLSRGGTDRPFFGQVNKTGNLDSENAVRSISISQTDSFPSGSNGVYGSSLARWQSTQAYASVVHQGLLVSSRPILGFSHFPRSLVQQGCVPMAEQGLFTMVPLCRPQPDLFLFTDASPVGWGAHMGDLSASGLWSAYWQTQHINVLELRAVMLALKSFSQLIPNCHILLSTDNTTVEVYLNKEGGGRGHKLCLSW